MKQWISTSDTPSIHYHTFNKSKNVLSFNQHNSDESCCGRVLPLQEVLKVFEEMVNANLPMNNMTCNVLIDFFCKAGMLEKAHYVIRLAQKQIVLLYHDWCLWKEQGIWWNGVSLCRHAKPRISRMPITRCSTHMACQNRLIRWKTHFHEWQWYIVLILPHIIHFLNQSQCALSLLPTMTMISSIPTHKRNCQYASLTKLFTNVI